MDEGTRERVGTDEDLKPAIPITVKDLGEQLPEIAKKMRTIAHIPVNHIAPPRDLFGWVEDLEIQVDGKLEMVPHQMTCSGVVPIELVRPEDVGGKVGQVPGHSGDIVIVPSLQPYLSTRYLLVESKSRVIFTYTVDLPPAQPARRHLSIQMQVPYHLAPGDLNAVQDVLLQQNEAVVCTFLPAAKLGVSVGVALRTGAPWRYVDMSLPESLRAAQWRTPVLFDFVMDHNLDEPLARDRRRSRIVDADGNPF